jgi:TPR repeat protein
MLVRISIALGVVFLIHGAAHAENAEDRQMSDAVVALDKRQYERAEYLLRRLAEREVPAAETLLGTLAALGREGRPPQYAVAAAWFLRAANRGYPAAQLALANAFAKGEGVTRDPKRALALARSAAQAGEPGASQPQLRIPGQMRLALTK